MQHKEKGFTLLELMVAVAIVAVLAAIAYPSYQDSLRKATRADAKAGLVDAATRLERFFTENDTYTTNLASIGADKTPEEYYSIIAAAGSTGDIATSYKLTALLVNSSRDPDCKVMSLTHTGVKSATTTDCW